MATVRQSRMRGPATGRSRAKRGLLPRRDHVGPWPSRPCSARCRQSWRMRCEIDARLYAGDRSPVPPSRRGRPDRCPPAPAWLRVPVRCVPSRLWCRNCTPVPVQSRETPQAPARRREPAPRSAAGSRREHEATRRSLHCRPRLSRVQPCGRTRAMRRSIVATQRPAGSWCVWSEAEKCLAEGERQFGRSQ